MLPQKYAFLIKLPLILQGKIICETYTECYSFFNIISNYFVCSLYNTIHVYNFASVYEPFIHIALKNAISLCMYIQLLTNCDLNC